MTAKAAKGYKGMGMEGPIARWYAQITARKMDEFKTGAKKIADSVAPGAAILEVAPGPGYLSVELARMGRYQVTGLDISHTLVQIAQDNAQKAGVQVDFRQGDVMTGVRHHERANSLATDKRDLRVDPALTDSGVNLSLR